MRALLTLGAVLALLLAASSGATLRASEGDDAEQASPDDATAPAEGDEAAKDDGDEAAKDDGDDGDDDWGDDDDADLDDLLDVPLDAGGGWEEEKKPLTFPWFEHHGYFRFRSDLFWRAHLGTDGIVGGTSTVITSGFYPPLTHNAANNSNADEADTVGKGRDEETIASANMRFRYSPTLHLTSDLRIHATFDVLDNIVLGSTPDFSGRIVNLRPDAPLVVLSDGQAPPESGRMTFQDSIRVKEAYGEWRSLLGLLRFGRTAEHWGLGMFRNGGFEPDADYGDYVDRAMWQGRFWGVDVMAALDFAAEGPTSAGAGQFFGQPYDLDQADDVWQVVFAVSQSPVTEEDRAIRKRDLDERRVPVIDWGFYNMIRWQDLDLSYESYQAIAGGDLGFASPTGSWDSVRFVQRDAWAWTPDLWLRFEWRPRYGQRLHIELEAAVVYGRFNAGWSVNDAGTADSAVASPLDVDILQYGGVLQADYTTGGLSFGMEIGLASGDDQTEGSIYTIQGGQAIPRPNDKLTTFIFDRDYHVDLLLFREVLGAVTNAMYFKPWVQYDLFEGEEAALGARFDMEYARAMEAGATPGNDANLGLEMDLRLFYEEKGRFLAVLEWGILFPFGAFDLVDGYGGYDGPTQSARWATTLQARIHWMF